MPLHLTSDGGGNAVALTNPRFSYADQGFTLTASDGLGDAFIKYARQPQINIRYNRYKVFLFARFDFSENDIFELRYREDGTRIGLIFPIVALMSDEHDMAKDPHFLRFSEAALMHLTQGISHAYTNKPPSSKRNELDLLDFYAENTIVVITYIKDTDQRNLFNIEDYLPSFFKYGYYLQSQKIDPRSIKKEPKSQFDPLNDKGFYIEKISQSLSETPFVAHVLQNLLPYENNNLASFFYYYQIFELLISAVLDVTFDSFKKSIAGTSNSSSQIREVLEELQENLSEKKRLTKLIADHLKSPVELANLRQSCNLFLNQVGYKGKGAEESRGIGDFLYPVRNTLFHNLRHVPNPAIETIEAITQSARSVVCDLLIHYKQ